ncbi:hypothetical protein JCM10213_000081 [Rhodosporidiobolus nylandii]
MPRPLPHELVVAIMEAGDKPTLAAWSRVSKATCAVAQPLLWRDIEISLDEVAVGLLQSLLDGGEVAHLVTATRTFTVEQNQDDTARRFSIDQIGLFTGLRSLKLVYLWLAGDLFRTPVTFAHLERLDLFWVVFPPSLQSALLTRASFPALRYLFLNAGDEELPFLDPALLEQLDLIHLHGVDVSTASSGHVVHPSLLSILASSAPVFIEVWCELLAEYARTTSRCNLLYNRDAGCGALTVWDQLEELADNFPLPPHSPRSIRLPPNLRNDVDKLARVEANCARFGTELIWWDRGASQDGNHEDLCAYGREQRRQQREQAEKEAAGGQQAAV